MVLLFLLCESKDKSQSQTGSLKSPFSLTPLLIVWTTHYTQTPWDYTEGQGGSCNDDWLWYGEQMFHELSNFNWSYFYWHYVYRHNKIFSMNVNLTSVLKFDISNVKIDYVFHNFDWFLAAMSSSRSDVVTLSVRSFVRNLIFLFSKTKILSFKKPHNVINYI